MIDKKYQGKGYGKKALEILLNEFKKNEKCKAILVDIVKGNYTAMQLLRKFDFTFINENETLRRMGIIYEELGIFPFYPASNMITVTKNVVGVT